MTTTEPVVDRWTELLDTLEASLVEAEQALASGRIPAQSGSWIAPVASSRMPEEHCARAAALLSRQHTVIAALAEASVRLRAEIRLISSLGPAPAASTPAFVDEPA